MTPFWCGSTKWKIGVRLLDSLVIGIACLLLHNSFKILGPILKSDLSAKFSGVGTWGLDRLDPFKGCFSVFWTEREFLRGSQTQRKPHMHQLQTFWSSIAQHIPDVTLWPHFRPVSERWINNNQEKGLFGKTRQWQTHHDSRDSNSWREDGDVCPFSATWAVMFSTSFDWRCSGVSCIYFRFCLFTFTVYENYPQKSHSNQNKNKTFCNHFNHSKAVRFLRQIHVHNKGRVASNSQLGLILFSPSWHIFSVNFAVLVVLAIAPNTKSCFCDAL